MFLLIKFMDIWNIKKDQNVFQISMNNKKEFYFVLILLQEVQIFLRFLLLFYLMFRLVIRLMLIELEEQLELKILGLLLVYCMKKKLIMLKNQKKIVKQKKLNYKIQKQFLLMKISKEKKKSKILDNFQIFKLVKMLIKIEI